MDHKLYGVFRCNVGGSAESKMVLFSLVDLVVRFYTAKAVVYANVVCVLSEIG